MSLSTELEQLEQLRQRGVLSETEFAKAKAQLLAAPAPKVTVLNGLRRSSRDQWLGGVCGGLGQFTGVDAWIWRLAFTLMLVFAGTGLFFYIVMWILIPLESQTETRAVPYSG